MSAIHDISYLFEAAENRMGCEAPIQSETLKSLDLEKSHYVKTQLLAGCIHSCGGGHGVL